MTKQIPALYSEIGCRIPHEYFWVIGWGESDVGIETGSYDAALHMAGIENYNVMLYTSVLPPETVELQHLPDIHHGSVLEGIMAIQHTEKPGTRITAGVLLAKVHRNSDGSYLGGFACEYAGNGSMDEAEGILAAAMQQLFARRYKEKLYKLEFVQLLFEAASEKLLHRSRQNPFRFIHRSVPRILASKSAQIRSIRIAMHLRQQHAGRDPRSRFLRMLNRHDSF